MYRNGEIHVILTAEMVFTLLKPFVVIVVVGASSDVWGTPPRASALDSTRLNAFKPLRFFIFFFIVVFGYALRDIALG